MGVNPSGAVVQAKVAIQAMVANPIEGPVQAANEPRVNPNCSGSLIPPKRRLVKEMMFECIVQAIASCFHPNPKHPRKKKNKNKIFSVQGWDAAQSDSSSSLNTKP
ncbi:hypothetical protein LOK49_LG08G01489 [Camellia lanceoleosa]|uniref:Uncharacterized protein n=1 Tax=Camellia lanceoleosa TaxID=1840588 RepID=A0ACC0GRD9_9ERIC|nr:hypothetical protein LOK49_LG08G01489 [Camellia lanceoleosa]